MIYKLSKIIYASIILSCCLIFNPVKVYSQTEFVPVELSRTAALHYASEIFGVVRFYSVETFFDLNDKPIVYVFTLYRKSGPRPVIDDIKSKVHLNRIKRIELEKESIDLSNAEFVEKNNERKTYWKKMRQEEDFVTVIASATYENVPVIQMYAGLPLHIVALEDTKEIASKALNTNNIFIKKYRYVAPLRFEFEFADNSGRNVLVSPLDLKIRDLFKLRQEKTVSTRVRKDRQAIIEKRWNFIKNLHREN